MTEHCWGENVPQFSRAGNICCGNKFCCSETQNVFAPSPKYFCLPDTNFASEAHVSQFSRHENNVDKVPVLPIKNAPSNGERTTLANREVEVEEPQTGERKGKGKKESNWTSEWREGSGLLSNRFTDFREIWYHKGQLQKITNYERTSPRTKKMSPQSSSKVSLL